VLPILRRFRLALTLGLVLAGTASAAHAQGTFPERPIRLVVAFTPGGATDVVARQIANDLKDAIGQPVVVENRPGANGQIAWSHVPYKGGGQAIGDVVAGHIDAAMSAISVARGLIEQGQVKGLAVTSPERSPVLPNVPSLRESGVTTADVELRFWWGIFGPAGMPQAVKAKLSGAVAAALASPQLRERLAKLDIDPNFALAPALQAKLANEITNWTKFIDERGIKAE
jgi:tripartite-type tricarboxylate transporter receptor subunit TctC